MGIGIRRSAPEHSEYPAVVGDSTDAVAKELMSKYGITAGRLKAYGVSSLSPVSSNSTDDGKAKNRRVELVAQ